MGCVVIPIEEKNSKFWKGLALNNLEGSALTMLKAANAVTIHLKNQNNGKKGQLSITPVLGRKANSARAAVNILD